MRHSYLSILCLLMCLHVSAQPLLFTGYDLNPGSAPSSPATFISYKGKLFFVATSATAGRELWISDGTLAGSSVLKDINPGIANGRTANEVVAYNGNLYFAADDGVNGAELWRSDGTAAGTYMVKDISPGIASASPASLSEFNGKLYFSAAVVGLGRELWVTDGTAAGTSMVKDVNPGLASGYFGSMYEYKNRFYFAANDGAHGSEIWVSDGTDPGTQMLKDINPGPGNSLFKLARVIRDSMFFIASDGNPHGSELWVTDGTPAGTQMFRDMQPGTGSGVSELGPVYNGKIYFNANNSVVGSELWVTDGTLAGTQMVKDIYPGTTTMGFQNSSSPFGYYVYDSMLYFCAFDTVNRVSLWHTDGTDAGTRKVRMQGGIYPNGAYNYATYKNKLYFRSFDDTASHNHQVFVTDGTDTGTHMLTPTGAFKNAVNDMATGFKGFIEYDSSLYFCAMYNADSSELWSLKDTSKPATVGVRSVGKTSIATIYPNPNNGNFTIKISSYNSGISNILTMYDITGRLVYSSKITAASTQVTTSGLMPGIYTIKLQQGADVVSTGKVVVVE